jgi:hypothetical protein
VLSALSIRQSFLKGIFMMQSNRIAFFSISVLALSFASPAFAAVDAQKFMVNLSAKLASYGMSATAESAESQGEDIVVKGLKIGPTSGADPIIVAELKLEGVTEKDGGYVIAQIAAPAAQYPVTDGSWDFGGAAVKNLSIPAVDSSDAMGGVILYESISMNPSKFVTSKGEEFIRVGSLEAVTSPYAAGQPMTFSMKPFDMYLNPAAAGKSDPKSQEIMTSLGLAEINAKIAAQGSWNPTDGKLTISESFDVQSAGKLNFKFDISGYTPALLKQMQDLAKQNAGKTDASNGMAMMGLMQQLTLNSAALRFDDASLTGKLLDLASKQMGQPKEAIVNQYKGMLPMMAAQLQDPEFVTMLSSAANAYLDNPKNIEIRTEPAAPVPFAQIMATGMAQPQALIKTLGVQVIANQ